jgi:ribosomal protein S6--L-glutamate ligase
VIVGFKVKSRRASVHFLGNTIMILSFHPCFDADVQIILGDRKIDSRDLELIRKATAIILPQGCSAQLYDACSSSNALTFPNYEMRFKYPGKMGQSLMFKHFRCPHPKTLIWKTVKEFKRQYQRPDAFPHKLPFLIKANKAHEAEGIHLVKDGHSQRAALEHLAHLERADLSGFVTQEFIPTEGNVLRAVIIGNRIVTYWKRPNRQGTIITAVSRGAVIDPDWRPDLQEKVKAQACEFSKAAGLDLAAIDFVFPFSEKDPEPLFLEVNYYFARRGLGGTLNYYRLLHQAISEWLAEAGLDPKSVKLV